MILRQQTRVDTGHRFQLKRLSGRVTNVPCEAKNFLFPKATNRLYPVTSIISALLDVEGPLRQVLVTVWQS